MLEWYGDCSLSLNGARAVSKVDKRGCSRSSAPFQRRANLHSLPIKGVLNLSELRLKPRGLDALEDARLPIKLIAIEIVPHVIGFDTVVRQMARELVLGKHR